MQVITDFIVYNGGKLVQVCHRNNDEHIVSGAHMSLIMEGEQKTRTTNDPNANIGDSIAVLDYMGCLLFTGKVVAKSVRLWDMSKPVGKRLVKAEISPSYNELHAKYSKTAKY